MVKEFELPEGYQRTEFGIIPNEWNFVTVEELIKKGLIEKPLDGNHGNIHPKSDDFVNDGIPFIMANDVWNGSVNLDRCHFIRKEQADCLQKGFSFSGDVLLTHKGTVGNVAIVGEIATDYIMLTPQVTYYRVKNSNGIINSFLKQYFLSDSFQKYIKNISGGGTRAYIGITRQRQLYIVLPTIKEQTAIATALSDTDALIESLEKLIAKKQTIKQGAMQELLSGRKRLAGFNDIWNVLKLGDLGICFSGGTPSTFNPHYWNGNIIWLPSGRIQNNKIYIQGTETTITQLGLDESAAKIIKPNSVLIAITGATCGNIGLLTFEASANQSVIAIEPNNKNDAVFLFYLLLQSRKSILSLQTGSAQGGVNLNSLRKLELCLPTLQEQRAIGNIIFDMDTEIEELENKLQKYHRIKQGMMQVLLTGKIRLV